MSAGNRCWAVLLAQSAINHRKNGEISIVFNTTAGARALADSKDIRRTALLNHIPYYTTLAGAIAVTRAIKALKSDTLKVAPLQSYKGYARVRLSPPPGPSALWGLANFPEVSET